MYGLKNYHFCSLRFLFTWFWFSLLLCYYIILWIVEVQLCVYYEFVLCLYFICVTVRRQFSRFLLKYVYIKLRVVQYGLHVSYYNPLCVYAVYSIKYNKQVEQLIFLSAHFHLLPLPPSLPALAPSDNRSLVVNVCICACAFLHIYEKKKNSTESILLLVVVNNEQFKTIT